MQNDGWVKPFLTLDLCGGTLVSILNDDEDMLEIRWSDGMWIDVGFIEEEKTYYITTVANDTLESWNNPLSVLKTSNRMDLVNMIQQEIFRCRKQATFRFSFLRLRTVMLFFRNKKDAYGRLFLLVEGLEAYEGEERTGRTFKDSNC